jgi:hypothetical protein
MDGVRAVIPGHDWPQPDLQTQRPGALSAAAADGDLLVHLSGLAEQDRLVDFLGQTDDAIQLAGSDPTFAGQLDPLLGRIRDTLGELPTDKLSRVERDAVQTTQQKLDAYLGQVDPPDGTGEVPGGGLEAHENAGSHLIERHVGKSEQDLIERLRKENISASSSFRDLPSAEHFIAATITGHQAEIDAWVDGQGGRRLVIDGHFDASTGISVQRGDSQAEDVFSVKLVLERSDKLGIGYRIVTGYPTAP